MGRRSLSQDARLEIVPDPDCLRTAAIGAAQREVPYWSLLDEAGAPCARLCLFFPDEETAVQEMRLHFERRMDYREMLPRGIRRQLRDVDVSPAARVVKIPYRPELVLSLEKITCGEGNVQAPDPLLAVDFDVARVIQQAYPFPYEMVVVAEQALETDLVHCSPGREWVFETVA